MGPQDSEIQMLVLYLSERCYLPCSLDMFHLLNLQVKKNYLGVSAAVGLLPVAKSEFCPGLVLETAKRIHKAFSKCAASMARITSLHTTHMPDKHLCSNYRKGLQMSKRHWVRVFLQPYPVLLAHVHGHLFLEGCCFSLCISLQVTERVSDHYRLVQTATKCFGNHPFWLEKYLYEGVSITPRIQGTGALILTYH